MHKRIVHLEQTHTSEGRLQFLNKFVIVVNNYTN